MAANNLAWGLLRAGHADEALPYAERAVQLAPGDPMALDTYAGVLEARGACAAALGAADRALELVPEGATDEQRAPWVERVARLSKACAPAESTGGVRPSSRFHTPAGSTNGGARATASAGRPGAAAP
jgi:tetratricopeptide (TPR) repeat protein